MTQIRTAVAVAAILAIGTAGAATAEQMTLRFNNWLPATHFMNTDVIQPWADKIAEVSEGRVRIELTASSLGAPARQFDLARQGVADIAWGVHGYTPGRFPLQEFAGLPFITKEGEAFAVAYWRVYEKHFKQADEHKGVKVLGIWSIPPGIIFTRGTPLQTVDDFQGVKLRVPSDTVAKMAEALGAVPVAESASNAYELMSRGVIDAAFWQSYAYDGFNLKGVAHGFTEVVGGFFNSSQFTVMNLDAWNRISEADREAITACCLGEKMAAVWSNGWQEEEEKGKEAMRRDKVAMHVIDGPALKELRDRLMYTHDQWFEDAKKHGVDGRTALEMLIREQDEYIKSGTKTTYD